MSIFHRELDVALQHVEGIARESGRTVSATVEGEAAAAAERVLEHAWRLESALGAFIALDPLKAELAGLNGARAPAERAFEALRERLTPLETEAARRPEAQVKAYITGWESWFPQVAREVEEARRLALEVEPAALATPQGNRARVAIAREPDRRRLDNSRTVDLIAAALEPLGGIGSFVRPGQTVLLKPNLTLFFLADEGAITDPRVVAGLARLCRDAGAGRVLVGESSGGGTRTGRAYTITGMERLCRDAGAELVDFHTSPQREVDIPLGQAVHRLLLPEPLLDADVVINVPKAKAHHQDLISCAVKNWVGVVRPDVRSAHHDWDTYQEYADIMTRVRPALNVVDAVVMGEGNGPGATRGRYFGGIVASTDPVATDVTVARMMGFDPAELAFAYVAARSGLGVFRPADIEVAGVPLEQATLRLDPPAAGVDYYSVNVIVGSGVSRPGTLGHFKSTADIWHQKRVWPVIARLRGRPTIMIGAAEDPLFEKHAREGPYMVIDDAARERYKRDPRVAFIPGHPVLHNMLPQMLGGLRVGTAGAAALRFMELTRRISSRIKY